MTQLSNFKLEAIIYSNKIYNMKEFTFISTKEELKDTLNHISPKFDTLYSILPRSVILALSAPDEIYCRDSFVFQNEVILNLLQDQPPKSIEQMMEEVVRQLLWRVHKPYVQCLGQQYKDFTLRMKSLNFGRTIIQSSPTFRNLFALMPHNLFYQMMLNNIIIVPYKGQYIQVAGRLLNEKYNMKAVGGGGGSKKNTPPPPPAPAPSVEPIQTNNIIITDKNRNNSQNVINDDRGPKVSTGLSPIKNNENTPTKLINRHYVKSYTYSNQAINRFQIFYCSSMNRASGFFSKNMFFDKGLKKSFFIHQNNHLVKKCIDEHFKSKINLSQDHQNKIYKILYDYFQNVRELFHIRNFRGKVNSKFDLLLARYCKLGNQYSKIKQEAKRYLNGVPMNDVDRIFNELYSQCTPYDQVKQLIAEMLRLTVPEQLLGPNNLKILKCMMENFISMKRFENYKIQEFLTKMDVFQLKWLECNFNKKFLKKIIIRRRKFLAMVVSFLVNELVVPVIKFNFYVTEKHKQANKIFYYRKPIWTLISKVALKRFSEENLEPVREQQVMKMKKNLLTMFPEGKLRILPKKGTFRPIITFNRKVEFQSDINPNIKLKATLNQYLSDTQLVLRNLKNILGDKFGYCIFDNRQIMKRYDAFVQKWRSMGCPPIKYFTLDIHKCYDSIDTSKLLRFIEQTNYIDEQYIIVKYNRLYRNKKPLFGQNSFTGYFNYKQRITAIPMTHDIMEIRQQHKIPAVNIFPAKQRLITKDAIINKLRRICEGSIVSYKKNYWLQKLGIPQGLNVSGVLCSLYFACLQDQYVKVKEGLLMRLTDDYFYIGPETQANKVLDSLLLCAQKNGFTFSEDKISKNFDHPILKKKSDAIEIVWIGKKINVQTLEMSPNFQMSQKIGYAMNVNLNKKSIKSFLKNKLKSLLTNHFASYFKPNLFSYKHIASNVRLYMHISLQKFSPFLTEVIKSNIPNTQELFLKVFKSCVHEFLLYACMLAESIYDNTLYRRLYIQVSEQIASFFKRKSSYSQFRSLFKIFHADCNRYKNQIASIDKIEAE